MVAIVDYGVGNLFSLKSSFAQVGAEVMVTGDPAILHTADRIVLPGVGAFGDAAAKLWATDLNRVLIDEARQGKPLLGICLGMQLLFEKSYEYGEHPGLGLVPGAVRPIREVVPEDLKIPHIGWNGLHVPANREKSPIFRDIRENDCVYFVHSYYGADCGDCLTATAEYGAELTAAVQNGNIYGTQFHPEKSGSVGLSILKAFCEVTPS